MKRSLAWSEVQVCGWRKSRFKRFPLIFFRRVLKLFKDTFQVFFCRSAVTLFHDILLITNPAKNLCTLNISKLNTLNWKFSNRSLQKLCHLHPWKSWNAHLFFNFSKFLFLLSTNRFMDDDMTVAIICEAARNNLLSQTNGRARN